MDGWAEVRRGGCENGRRGERWRKEEDAGGEGAGRRVTRVPKVKRGTMGKKGQREMRRGKNKET